MMNSKIPAEIAGAVLSVDLGALRSNYSLLAKKAGKAGCGAAIKGDAYGLGLAPVASVLWDAGCRNFFVARPKEGEDVRKLLPNAVIYVLDGLYPGQAEYYAGHALRPALISLEQAREWSTFSQHLGKSLPCALHLDTGINRIGFSVEDFKAVTEVDALRSSLNITLLISHLACADDPDHPLNKKQLLRFSNARAKLPGVPASLANSSGIFLGKNYTHDLVRPGIALYGGNPTPGKKNPMKPVATLAGTVLQVRDVKKGETVGYSATWKASCDSRIAMLGAGYRDGIPRMLSSRQPNGPSQVFAGGRRCPIVGRVSMDMMGIDVTELPSSKIPPGSRAEIFGRHIPVDEAAAWAGTISYELLTRLGSRYARVYLDASQAHNGSGNKSKNKSGES